MDNLTESDKVNKLYSCYGILADCPPHEISQKEDTYKHILMAVNGGEKEKRLACQFIPVFFKYFPGLADMALDALFDLCEDTDVAIRRQAIKELAIFCRDCVRYTKKVTMTLSQLLLVKDPTELRIVHAALLSLFSIDTKAAIIGLFAQIRFGEDAIKDTCLRFLSLKMGDICDEVMKNGGEELLMRKIMTTLREATLEDIPLLLKIALSTRRARSIEGKQELGLALLSLLESEGPFDPSNNERIQRLIIYLKHMHLLYSAGESLGCYKVVYYITEEVLPLFLAISGCEEGVGYPLEILQLLAEITSYADKLPHSEKAVCHVWNLLMEFLPERPYEDKANLNLSYIEYLLFTLHRIIKFCPAVIDKDAEKLKRLRIRLKHVALVVLGYCSYFGTNVDDKNTEDSRDRARKRKWSLISNDPSSESSSDSSPLKTIRWKEASDWSPVERPNDSPICDSKRKQIREVASDVCSNILKLANDFFQDPVECAATVELSSLLERS